MEGIVSMWIADCENTILADDDDTIAWVVTEADLAELEDRLNREVDRRHAILVSDLEFVRLHAKRQTTVVDTLKEVITQIASIK